MSQVGTDVDYHCAKSLRADLRIEQMRELRVKGFHLSMIETLTPTLNAYISGTNWDIQEI